MTWTANQVFNGTATLNGANTLSGAQINGAVVVNGATLELKSNAIAQFDISTTLLMSAGTHFQASGTTFQMPIRTVSSNYTIDSAGLDWCILGDTSSSSLNITMPVPSSGRFLCVKVKAPASHIITLFPNGSETIDNASSYTMSGTNLQGVFLQSDGTNWHILNRWS
jgi:hypothetical protein